MFDGRKERWYSYKQIKITRTVHYCENYPINITSLLVYLLAYEFLAGYSGVLGSTCISV